MSVQSMACPKCGKQATEYDAGKWHCLNPRCQIKFVYEKPLGMVVNKQTVVSVEASSLYDLDLKNKEDHTSREVYKKKENGEFSLLIFLFLVSLVIEILCVMQIRHNCVIGWDMIDDVGMGLGIASILGGIGFVVVLLGLAGFLMDKVVKNGSSRLLIGHNVFGRCPHCKREFSLCASEKDDITLEIISPFGLIHCTSCGRQIVVTQDYTCAITKLA